MDYAEMKHYLLQQEMENINLNNKQKIAWNIMIKGENLFITGSAGTGKSFLLSHFKKMYHHQKNIAVTSLTGVSALLIKGTTIHSYLGIGLGTGSVEALKNKIMKTSYIKKRWRELHTLIIDEISMLSPSLFDKLEEVARLVRVNDRPFGGIQLILLGDYCQLPVVKSTKYCFEAKTWEKCVRHVVHLTDIIRQENKDFQECLNNIRLGNITPKVKKMLQSRVGIDLTNKFGIKPTQFFPTNILVDEINEEELDLLAEQGADFYEYDSKVEFHEIIPNRQYATDKFIKDCPAVKTLQLCIGVQVMLIHNLDVEQQLVNGSRGVVVKFSEDKPVVKFLNGKEIVIDYHTWDQEKDDKKLMSITQIPLKIGYAYTIHKAQGVTLDYAIVDISNIFEYGMAYVVLSRVKTLEGLSIIGLDFDKIQTNPKVLKYYKDLENKKNKKQNHKQV